MSVAIELSTVFMAEAVEVCLVEDGSVCVCVCVW